MIDEIFELEQIYGTVVCGVCGDTGYLWGDPKNGVCVCYDPSLEEENKLNEILERLNELIENAQHHYYGPGEEKYMQGYCDGLELVKKEVEKILTKSALQSAKAE